MLNLAYSGVYMAKKKSKAAKTDPASSAASADTQAQSSASAKLTAGKTARLAKPGDTVRIPLAHHWPEGQRGIFANHLLITFDGKEFHLSFFEIRPPAFLGSEEEIEEQARHVEQLDANCVARIVISKDRMPAFARAIHQNVENHLGPLTGDAEKGDD